MEEKDLNLTGTLVLNNQSGTSVLNTWNDPIFIKSNEVGESIEFIYTETSSFWGGCYPSTSIEKRVFKIVYSCIDGKWNKSDRIYGEINSPQDESYEFDN